MKTAFAVCAALIILSVSCKKTNDQMNPPPPVPIDTTKPPVIKIDTSTLLKSSKTYSIGAGGAIGDSALEKWTYDDQRRITMDSNYSYSAQHLWFVTNTYLSDRYLSKVIVSDSGNLTEFVNSIYYQHLQNHTDSMTLTSTGYGQLAGQTGSNASYYYYNTAGRDSLVKQTQNSSISAGPTVSILKYYYTGANLDSTINSYSLNVFVEVKYYSNGNRTMDELFSSGMLVGRSNYTFSNVPSGDLVHPEL